jgi:hypothetical protein
MSIQNGSPGQSVNFTGPINSFTPHGLIQTPIAQHPLASPLTQHINQPDAAPVSPGAHIPQTGPNNAITPIGIPPRFSGTGRL